MRDGLSLTDQAIAYGGGQFDEALVRSMLGLADANVAHELLAGLARRDAVQVLALVQQMRESGVACDTTLEQMALLLQQAAVEQAVPGALGLEHTDAPAARDLAAALTPEEVQLLYSLLVQGRPELSLLSDVSAAFSMVLLRYLAFPAVPSVAASSPRSAPLRAEPLARARVLVPAAIVAAPAPAPAPAEPVIPRVAANSSSNITAPASLQPTPLAAEAAPRSTVSPQQTANLMPPDVAWDAELGQSWDACVRRMADRGQLSGLVRELAWQSAPRLAAGGAALGWVLVTAHEALRAEHLRDKLAAALAELEGQPVALQIEPGTPQGTPAQRDAAQRARRQHEAELSIQQDPVVRELLSQFKGARVVPGSIKPL